ncbi:carbohydrate kinase family protein [Subtercola sp. YIM 133946]|uniref:carbohydrate kinase family protein n=1 Tax=Subtercola sp. YIM 133946 TaxID=3118909 RepID=UPI002F94B027
MSGVGAAGVAGAGTAGAGAAEAGVRGGVVVVGDALIDEFRTAEGSSDFVGGAGLNVATGLRILGVPSTLVAMVGDDSDGTLIRQFLAEYDVALVETLGRFGSSRAISDRTEGEPRYIFNEAAQKRHLAFDPATRRAFDEAALVVVSCFPFDDTQQADALFAAVGAGGMDGAAGAGTAPGAAAATAAGAGRRLVLDPNPRAGMLSDRDAFVRNFERLAATSLLTKIGDEDCELLYGEPLDTVAERLVRQGAASVLATAGRAGASIRTAGGLRVDVPIAAFEGCVVDTMGAGDATLASTAASIRQFGLPSSDEAWLELLERAMLIAAATCRHPGALLRLP